MRGSMTGLLGACRHPWGPWARRLQNAVPSGQWEKTWRLSFRTCPGAQPCGCRSPVIQRGLPRWLGISAPSQRAQEGNPAESPEDFRLIYRFPGIRYFRVLSRMKLLQTAFTALILPPIWFLYWQNQVALAQCLVSTGVASFAGIMLYAMSYFFRRLIGMMYLNRDGTVLRVSHLTFWGKRRDIYFPVEAVMTLDDVGEDRNNLLLCLQRYDGDQFFYYTLRFGQVVDKEGFAIVFGNV